MAYPISVKKNDYNINKKDNTIKTPIYLCERLADILKQDALLLPRDILDVGCGDGRLGGIISHKAFGGICKVTYIDTNPDEDVITSVRDMHEVIVADYLAYEFEDYNPNLIVCNPPFNNINNSKKLLPELFLNKMFKDFGEKTPIILFAPMGFLKNQRKTSKRYQALMNTEADITSIISLPIDAFEGVAFHSEILCFNIRGLKPHYFIDWSRYKKDEEYEML